MTSPAGPEHASRTRRSGYRYFFYAKHHATGPSRHAQWLPDLGREDEFSVFNIADEFNLSNSQGDLFGLLVRPGGSVEILGTRDEQVAEFPVTPRNQAWHGYPLWPIRRHDDAPRKSRPPADALRKMEESGIIDEKQRSRLARGKPI